MVCKVGCCMSRNSPPMLLMSVRATAVQFCSTGRPSSSPPLTYCSGSVRGLAGGCCISVHWLGSVPVRSASTRAETRLLGLGW